MSNGATSLLRDGALTLDGGVDGGKSPSVIRRNQVARAVNTTFRGAFASTRPGFIPRALNFGAGLLTPFQTTRFQHGFFYDGNGSPALLSSHGGRQFRIDLRTFNVSEITPPDGPNSSIQREAWSVQAENYWILQDNQSLPIIFDGSSSRRANPALSEVPVGNVMAYSMGRLVVALTDHQSFRAGDLLFGPSGTAALGYKDSILRFTENNYLNEGGDFVARVFGAPSGYGPITAMRAIAMNNAQLGQGPLIIGTPNVMFTINLPFDRTIWKNMSNALQTVNPIRGPLGANSMININDDIWLRSVDGIRSYIFAQRIFNQEWGNVPMSSEVDYILNFDTQNLVRYSSAVLFDNRMLMTVSPVPSQHGIWHRGLVVMDFDLVSSLGQRSSPAWEGLWTGLRILQIVTGTIDNVERCFVYALNDADEIELWELTTNAMFDNVTGRIQWSVDFASYIFADSFQPKRLQLGELFIDNVSGTVDYIARYRPDQHPCFLDWDQGSVCAKNQDCELPVNCEMPKQYVPQFRSKIRFHMPPDNPDDINRRWHQVGYEFQPRLEMTGYCRIKQLRLLAEPVSEKYAAEATQP